MDLLQEELHVIKKIIKFLRGLFCVAFIAFVFLAGMHDNWENRHQLLMETQNEGVVEGISETIGLEIDSNPILEWFSDDEKVADIYLTDPTKMLMNQEWWNQSTLYGTAEIEYMSTGDVEIVFKEGTTQIVFEEVLEKEHVVLKEVRIHIGK